MTELTHATATPFQKAGYTKDTKFRLLMDFCGFRKGDVVILDRDNGSICPFFKFADSSKNRHGESGICILLPGETSFSSTRLEVVYEESTPLLSTITHNLTIKGYTHVLTTEELCEVLSIIEAAVG